MAVQYLNSVMLSGNVHNQGVDLLYQLCKDVVSDKLPVGNNAKKWFEGSQDELRCEVVFCYAGDALKFIGNDATFLVGIMEYAGKMYEAMGMAFDPDLTNLFNNCVEVMCTELLTKIVTEELQCRRLTKRCALLVLNRKMKSDAMRLVFDFL